MFPDQAVDVVRETVGVLQHVVGLEREVLTGDVRGLGRPGVIINGVVYRYRYADPSGPSSKVSPGFPHLQE